MLLGNRRSSEGSHSFRIDAETYKLLVRYRQSVKAKSFSEVICKAVKEWMADCGSVAIETADGFDSLSLDLPEGPPVVKLQTALTLDPAILDATQNGCGRAAYLAVLPPYAVVSGDCDS